MGDTSQISKWNGGSQKVIIKPLRKCRDCGLEAWEESDLELFIQRKSSKYGRRNICKKCFMVRKRKRFSSMSEEEIESNKEYHRNWEKTNTKRRNRKKMQLRYKDKDIRFDFNLRKNVCSVCEKSYPKELKRQTDLHHIKYEDNDPLAHTIELCVSCHLRLHRTKDAKLISLGHGKYQIKKVLS